MPGKNKIPVDRYLYDLPRERIARYPLPQREQSRLLTYTKGTIGHRHFRDLPGLLPPGSWLVLNNTRVIQARLPFRKSTGAAIEVFCLEPVDPAEYQMAFESTEGCTWKCLIGNARKWKSGPVFLEASVNGFPVTLKAIREEGFSGGERIRFEWDTRGISFGEIIEQAGRTPIPPYLNREAEESDRDRYQTIYSFSPGSVAAPTAGLHFTDHLMTGLKAAGIPVGEITLHVGAGTFVPVKHRDARDHRMHSELVLVERSFLEYWQEHTEGLIAVGTTTTRSLETLYWMGVRLLSGQSLELPHPEFRQWDNEKLPQNVPLKESLSALVEFCRDKKLDAMSFSTSLMIVPGYRFRTLGGLITNFHMPGSTLLMLIAALIGNDWQNVYQEALDKGYRFLSYGDSSLLLP
jgi:S-adenosylmethionine:tRNA ribosyltransferase-isomerase